MMLGSPLDGTGVVARAWGGEPAVVTVGEATKAVPIVGGSDGVGVHLPLSGRLATLGAAMAPVVRLRRSRSKKPALPLGTGRQGGLGVAHWPGGR